MYFREFDESLSVRSWYYLLRGLVNIVFGLTALLKPELITTLVLQLFGIWIIINNLIQITPFFLGRITRRLWPEAIASSVIGLIIGFLAFTNNRITINIATFLVGLLIIFRAILEIGILVKSRMSAIHQRWLLIWVTFSMLLSINVFAHSFEMLVLERTIGQYAVWIGINNILVASRKSRKLRENTELMQTRMKSDRKVPVHTFDDYLASASKQLKYAVDGKPIKPGEKINLSKYKRPIVLAAHPDDLEAFAGGLVFQLKDVLSVIYSGGDKGIWNPQYREMDKDQYIRLRLKETSEAGKLLGVSEIIYMGYLDRSIKCTEESVRNALSILERYEPDLVVSFEYHRSRNIDPHPDHIAVGEITRRAVMQYKGKDILDYIVMATLFPNVFVDVSDVRRIKVTALGEHDSQDDFNSIIFPFLEKFITRLWGAYNGVDFAEGYRYVDTKSMKPRD
jgi:LmbE family N-acetylglucosaminyl deacetylase/uncharacterized membrane protein HdeD (DUF308 family)